uniref:Metalloendopeptidase n=2 Tax=Parastrongyloides trichosuri TaxID=131310 RepID=A0A0N4Z2W7_PARTI
MNITLLLIFILKSTIVLGSMWRKEPPPYPWKFPIPVYTYAKTQQSSISRVAKQIEENTCVRFTFPYDPFTTGQGIVIKFGDKCTTYVVGPETPYGSHPNTIYFNEDKCPYKDFLFQRFFHIILGQVPENLRRDRDKYIAMHWENIKSGFTALFFEKEYDYYPYSKFDYDYGSITHMWNYDYAESRNMPVFSSRNYSNIYGQTFGQLYHISFHDYKKLNYILCRNECRKKKFPKIKCYHGGYQNPNKCDECKCPSEFKGKHCEEYVNVEGYILGGVVWYSCPAINLIANSNWQGYHISSRRHCFIYIKAYTEMNKVLLKVIQYKGRGIFTCHPENSIEVKYKADKGLTGLCLCLFGNTPFDVESEDDLITIHYYEREAYNHIKFEYKSIQ